MAGEQFLRTAYAYLYIRDFDRAAEAFDKAIASDPDNSEYYFHASVTQLRSEHYDRALRLAQDALQREPHNQLFQEHVKLVESTMFDLSGQAALNAGEFATAKQNFRYAIERNPLNFSAADALAKLEAMERQVASLEVDTQSSLGGAEPH